MTPKKKPKPSPSKKFGTPFNAWQPKALAKQPAATIRNIFIK